MVFDITEDEDYLWLKGGKIGVFRAGQLANKRPVHTTISFRIPIRNYFNPFIKLVAIDGATDSNCLCTSRPVVGG